MFVKLGNTEHDYKVYGHSSKHIYNSVKPTVPCARKLRFQNAIPHGTHHEDDMHSQLTDKSCHEDHRKTYMYMLGFYLSS